VDDKPETETGLSVAVIGASDKPDRYSYLAVKNLRQAGHRVFPVHPRLAEIEGLPVFHSVRDIPHPIHTVTLYVGPERSTSLADDILSCQPRRVIFNPGAENPALESLARQRGIQTVTGCTLVMLSTRQF
jgi:predicted CoA-binding protein